MDRERLGRVLGRGARMAARTAYEAVDAATSPGPAPAAKRARAPELLPPQPAQRGARPASAVSREDIARASVAATRSVAGPLKRASKALWHELTGCFFALFALSFSAAVWKTRDHAHSTVADIRYRFYAFCALAILFLYFSISSFVRARRVS